MNMDTQLLDEVIASLPEGKTHYRYFKGAFAPRILAMLLPGTAGLHTLKRTRFTLVRAPIDQTRRGKLW